MNLNNNLTSAINMVVMQTKPEVFKKISPYCCIPNTDTLVLENYHLFRLVVIWRNTNYPVTELVYFLDLLVATLDIIIDTYSLWSQYNYTA